MMIMKPKKKFTTVDSFVGYALFIFLMDVSRQASREGEGDPSLPGC
jgi:hypothetical protein